MGFTPALLLAELQRLPRADSYWIAFSGGLDSLVLLHALAAIRERLPARLRALHVDHGLQSDSLRWAAGCERQSLSLKIPLEIIKIEIIPKSGVSLEALAREARYRALGGRMAPGDILLTAHHQDDQAETLLLQLLRGSGVSGLAAMPSLAALGDGWLARPLLGFSRSLLANYARAEGLEWIEDPSNRHLAFDRNYLRHQVIPVLRARWPALGRSLSRSARHCAEAQTLIDELARRDLAGAVADESGCLDTKALRSLPAPRCRAVLRQWIARQGLPLPPAVALDRILDELLTAAQDRCPEVIWRGAEVRRFRGKLYLLPPLPPFDRVWSRQWDGRGPLILPAGLGRLLLEPVPEMAQPLSVSFRRGGERCRPLGSSHSRSLKQLLQEAGVPPWERGRIPLVWREGELAAVGDLWCCGKALGETLRWERGS